MVGEYGSLSGHSVESIMDKLAAIPDTQTATEEVGGQAGGGNRGGGFCLGVG